MLHNAMHIFLGLKGKELVGTDLPIFNYWKMTICVKNGKTAWTKMKWKDCQKMYIVLDLSKSYT